MGEKATFLQVINNPVIYKFFKDFTNHRKETNRVVGFSNSKSGKQDYFRHILESSVSMYESSGSQVFRTNTGIPSGPGFFDQARFVMTFLTIFGIMEILCNFRLVVEGKTGKEIPESSKLESLEKFLANNFVQFIPHRNKVVLHRNRLNSIC